MSDDTVDWYDGSVVLTKTTKGEQTRARILETALDLFRENGYDKTTMRRIAEKAGVSLGNAYYYFASKEMLIQGFYERTHKEHIEVCRPILEREKNFKKRLVGVLKAKFETTAQYHRFAGVLFKSAADPKSPLNPFSDESKQVRDESKALFAEVFHGSDAKATKKLEAEMPDLLWAYQMGLILYWIHDDSEGAEKSMKLVDHTADLVAKLVSLSRLPLMRSVVHRTLKLVTEMKLSR